MMIFYLFLFIFGTAVGSFLNVLIDRLPKGEPITGRSYCDHCQRQLKWYHLFPIISYLLLGGRCQYCKKKISWFYPLVEFLTGTMFVISYWLLVIEKQIGYYPFFIYLGIISCLIVIFFSDWKYHLIPDSMQIVFFGLSLFLLPFFGFLPEIFAERVIAAFLVMAPILFLYLITQGKGMGFGDVKLSFTIGFLLGSKAGFLALYFAFVIGGIVGLFLILLGKKKLKSKIAFGPFLVLGTIIMLFFSDKVWQLIFKIYSF